MAVRLFAVTLILGMFPPFGADAQALYEGDGGTMTDTSVVQDAVRVETPSRTKIVATDRKAAVTVDFTFVLLHAGGEQHRGVERQLRLGPSGQTLWTPVYVFGEAGPDAARPATGRTGVTGDSVAVTFRVDLRPVRRQFRNRGRYEPPAGDPIAEGAFEGIAVHGSTPPLGRRSETDGVRLTDPDGDGVYRTTVVFDRSVLRSHAERRTVWAQSTPRSKGPSYTSDQRLVDALYNRAMETILQDPGGEEPRDGRWRQETSYRTLLSLAFIDPDGAQQRLLQGVENGRIRSDAGLGGGWPITTGRMAWALAAWEVFKTTGDTTWLQKSYDVIRRSANADLRAAVDERTGLVSGAALLSGEADSFYPAWMDPVDVYQTPTLRTNVVHYRTYRILTQMARVLGTFPDQWARVARRIKQGLNEHLWQPEEGRYAAYQYGGVYGAPAARSDAMGNALVVLSGVTGAKRARRVVRNQPVVDGEVPTLWPLPADEGKKASPAPRPAVTAYWTWASAAAQNSAAVEHGLASLYRTATLAGTGATTPSPSTDSAGSSRDTEQARADRAAGVLSTIYRVVFGLRATPDGLTLAPFVPAAYSGTRTLEGVPYRDATLDVTMKGHGTRIVQVTLDGTPLDDPVIPAGLTGPHEVRVLLSGGLPDGEITRVESETGRRTPVVRRVDDGVAWDAIDTAAVYRVVRNGRIVDTTAGTHHAVAAGSTLTEVQVQAMGESGTSSFRSEPVRVIADPAVQVVPPSGSLATEYEGYTGDGYRRLAGRAVDSLTVAVPDSGIYALDFRYAHGHEAPGPACALRGVAVGDERVGTAVLPPRGQGTWSDWGYSNRIRVSLTAGTHTVVLAPEVEGQGTRPFHLDHLRVTPLAVEKTNDTP